MIFDNLKNAYYYFPPGSRLAKAIEFIKTFESSKPDGRYEIDGDRVYAVVSSYKTKPAEQQVAESHKKYIDLQTLVRGRERIDVTSISEQLVVTKIYDEINDAVYYGPPTQFVRLELDAGIFAVFFPQDVHRPCCNPDDNEEEIRKIVVKIAIL